MTTSLSRNRNYRLLWGSQVLSEFGISASTIAFPLLVLATTGSAAASGLVLGTIAVAQLVAGLPAGALVDCWNRKKVMLACEAAQALAAGSLVAALWWGVASVAHMTVVAAVLGLCGALFEPAEEACLPTLVPDEQLPTALAMNSARTSLGHLSGTAVGGFLFAVARFVPFVVDLLTHTMALVGLMFLRVPPREVRRHAVHRIAHEMAAGVRWVWGHRHIRVTALGAVVLNLFFSAFYLIVIVLAEERGVPSGEIGVMAAMLGVGGILGSLVAPYLHRAVSPYLSIVGVFWVLALLTPLATFIHNGYLMGALFAAMAFLPPTANTTIMTGQLLLTPDELRGRLSAVMGVATGVAAAVGPALGGTLVGVVSGDLAVLLCAGGIAAVAVVVTASPALRRFPRHPTGEESPVSAQAQERRAEWDAGQVGAPSGSGARNGDTGRARLSLHTGQDPAVSAESTPTAGKDSASVVGPGHNGDRSGLGIFGQVRSNGRPLSAARLTLTDLGGRQLDRVLSNRSGHYRLTANRGMYLVIAASEGHRPQASQVAVDDRLVRHDVVLLTAGSLAGVARFSGPAGRGMAGVTVTLTDMRGVVVASTVTEADGGYRFAEVAGGRYTVTAAANGFQPVAAAVAVPVEGKTTHDLELAGPARLVGRVCSATAGQPVGEALATLVDDSGTVVASAVTDHQGGFVFDDLAEGSYTVTATSYPPATIAIQLAPGERTEAEIALSPPSPSPKGQQEATSVGGLLDAPEHNGEVARATQG